MSLFKSEWCISRLFVELWIAKSYDGGKSLDSSFGAVGLGNLAGLGLLLRFTGVGNKCEL